MRTKRKIISIVVIWVFVMGILSVAHAEYRFGILNATTGAYAGLGVHKKKGIMLAIEKINKEGGINGEEVVGIYEDFESDPSKAISLAKKLIIQDKVIAILDCGSTAASLAVKKVTEKRKIVQVNTTPRSALAVDEPWPAYYFQTVPDNSVDAQKIGDFVKSLGVKRVSIIHDSNQYGTSGAIFQNDYFKKAGIEVVLSDKYQKTDRDLTSILIKARDRKTEAVVVWGTIPTPAVIAKNIRQLGMKVHYIGSSGLGSPKLIQLAKEAAEGIVFTSALAYGKMLPNEKPLFDAYKKKYDKFPNYFTALGWDCVMITVEAIKRVGGSKDTTKIRNSLESLSEFYGVIGKYKMNPTDHNGLDTSALHLVKIIGGKWVVLD